MDAQTVKTKKIGVRLPKFFNTVRIFSFAVIIFFISIIYYFPEYFEYVMNKKFLIFTLLLLNIWDIFFYAAIAPFSSRKVILYANNIAWAIFMMGVVYSTGGIHSPFIITLVFPILTTAFDLEAKAAKIIGGFTVAIFIVQFFSDTRFIHGKSYFSLGITGLMLLVIATYYTYSIIKESLRQKYEKEEAARKYSDLLEADKAKSEFITIASHQLRTPLTELKWSIASLSEDGAIPDAARESIIRTKGSIDKIMKVADSILFTSEQTKDEFKHNPAPFNIITVLEEVIDESKEMAKRRGVTIKFADHSEKIIIPMDKQKMRLALVNIIDNAIRYSPNGNVNISIKENSEIIISIADNGIGIPEDQQDRIFTKLFRARNAVLTEPNETGLGLYITKSIIERHGGRIWFSSGEGKGTTFFVALPK